jgi:hypothetical protein
MAYGLRYNLQQALRDGGSLFVNIYKDGYTGSVYNYTPTAITISPNTNSDEPEPGIISSQLNLSFVLSSQDDYTNFPNLLTFNDREFYVELTRIPLNGTEAVVWKGFMFNDYVNVPFTTGNLQVNVTCIDALSFMKNSIYAYTASSNQLQNLYQIISEGLNSIGFPSAGSLYQCCSYFGSLMSDRSIAASNEPFGQTYIYKRDLQQQSYYDIIEQIVKSFGCRLFQQNGDWWIMSANEMAAATIYFTKYNLTTNTSTGGTLSNGVTISPYNGSNIYFINNSQNKITRKGYPVVKVNAPVEFKNNYIANGTFKINSGGVATNWLEAESGTGTVTLIPNTSEPYDIFELALATAGGGAVISYTTAGTLPYLYPPGFSLSFDCSKNNTFVFATAIFKISISVENSIGERFYANSSGVWGAPGAVNDYVVNTTAAPNVFETITYNLQLGAFNISGTNYNVEGYLRVEFTYVGTTGFSSRNVKIRNVNAIQSSTALPSSLIATRFITTANSLTKDFESTLGIYRSDIQNCYGALFYSNGAPITLWYRFSYPGTTYPSLPILVARELSNLFNKNYATLEGELGETIISNNVIYLNNTYTITDSASSALTYNGKKFIANRSDVDLYINQENNLQLLEITNTDNTSSESIKWELNG